MVHGPGSCVRTHPHHRATIAIYSCDKHLIGHGDRFALLLVDVGYESGCSGRGKPYERELPIQLLPAGTKLEAVEARAKEWLIERMPLLKLAKLQGREPEAPVQKWSTGMCLECMQAAASSPGRVSRPVFLEKTGRCFFSVAGYNLSVHPHTLEMGAYIYIQNE